MVEIVVVVSIIAVLMVLAVAPARTCREYARDIVCRSNLKQLSVAFATYEVANGTFPPAFHGVVPMEPPEPGYAGNLTCDRPGWWWFNYVGQNDYTEHKSILWCPSRKTDHQRIDNLLHGNYGVNESVCKRSYGIRTWAEIVGRPLNLSEITSPARTLMMLDCGYAAIAWWHATDESPHPLNTDVLDTAYVPGMKINTTKKLWEGQHRDAIRGRHRNKRVNIAFADGHVDSKPAENLFVRKDPNSYDNLYPLWMPKWSPK